VDDGTPLPLRAEIQLYRWAAGTEEHRAEARAEVLKLVDAGVRSPGWDFEPVLAVARRDGRDDVDELERAAASISTSA